MNDFILDTDSGKVSNKGFMIVTDDNNGTYTLKNRYVFEDKYFAKLQCPKGCYVVSIDMMSGKMKKV